MAEEALPRLDPVEAIAFFRSKGWEIGFDWRDVWQEEHARAFTVAKAMTRDLLEDIRAAVDSAIAEGKTLRQFATELRPRLVAKGWWGRKLEVDAQTHSQKVVQLGSPARLRMIYETNLRTSYMAGRWQRIERTKRTLPLLRYVSVMDGRERPEHHDWHGTILPVDDPWWDTHYPPCGWGCRCDGQALNQRMLDRKGWQLTDPKKFPERDYINKRTGEVTRLERGIDPGWSYNVGKASLDALTPSPRIGLGKGEEEALQATLSEGDYRAVSGFFAAFGIRDSAGAVKGVVWEDAAGWPMAISLGLLRRPDGTMARLDAGAVRSLRVAARVMTEPETIGLVWVTALDRRALLVRRYRSAWGVVDIGGSFWRWFAGSPRRFDTGRVVWPVEKVRRSAKAS